MQLENMKLNGYTLKYLLGKGGMAEVWYAENNLGKPAAIKIMLSKFIGEEQVVKRFESEAKAIVQLNHPNIRQVVDYGDFENRPFIIMEYLEGEDLGKLMQKGERFSDEVLKKWWKQCVSALEHTHSKGIIHRDIKPSNLFLDKSGNIKILDFGIAKVRDEMSMT
ncbi:MAG: serine/threonine protein kinase, partial [Chitinophagales bacterium]|nr:serine/threonine protein kinase [Chitinophagales bacterium]